MMKHKGYFLHCLALQFTRAKHQMLGMLALVLATLALGAAIAAALASFYAGNTIPGITLAIASEDGDERIEAVLDLMEGMPDIGGFATLRAVKASEAKTLVRSGEVNAAVVLPAGFFQSLMTGENLPPTLLVDTSRPLEALLTAKLAESAARMLTTAQGGIAVTMACYDEAGLKSPERQVVLRDINLAYAGWVLSQSGMYRASVASMPGALSVTQHYLLYAVLYLMLLCLPLWFNLFALSPQQSWLGRMHGAGCPLWVFTLSQIAAGTMAIYAMLALLLAGIALPFGVFSPAALATLLPVALLVTCFGYLCCNTGHIQATVGLCFIISTVALLCCGGLVPRVLLPAPLAAAAPYIPLGWMHGAMAQLFGAPLNLGAFIACTAAATALLAACLLFAARWERRRL